MNSQLPSDLEDRIRDAYQAAGRTVQPQTLRRTTPRLAAGPARRPGRLNALIPVAAAVAVLAVIGASLALPRLLAGPSGKRGTSASAVAHEPPFQVIVAGYTGTFTNHTSLLVRTPAGQVDGTLAAPPGSEWSEVTATRNPLKFIVATTPYPSDRISTRLYTLTLSARGAVARLTPLAVGPLPVQLGSLAADVDGGVIGFSGQTSGAEVVGAVIGNQVKQWTFPALEGFPLGNLSVTSTGDKIAFVTRYNDAARHFAVMVLATGSAPGNVLARATTVASYDYTGKDEKDPQPYSVAISPDGNWVYVAAQGPPPGDKLPTTLTAYRASGQGAPVAIATWSGGEPALLPIGGMLFAWMTVTPTPTSASFPAPTAYLIDPATRTKTAVRLPGVPGGQTIWNLAW